jgi:diguanylate cyclase
MAASHRRGTGNADCTIAETVLDEMLSTGRPVTPLHFEFWFTYNSGRNAALNAAVEEMIATQGAISAEQVEALYERHLSPWRLSDGCDAITGRLSDQLQELSASLDEAIGASAANRKSLVAEARNLSASGVTLQRAIQSVDRLMQSAREGKARHAVLEAKLDLAKREIGALQKQLDVVREESQAEPVTSLIGRGRFDRALAKAADKAARDSEPLALMIVDLDYFDSFNERFGRKIGDEVLRAIGILLRSHLRRTDIVGRFGDDEFAALLPSTGIDEAVKLADRFRQVLMTNELARNSTGTLSGRLTASISIAGHVAQDNAERLLKRALVGLKIAKKEGRNRVVEMKRDGPVWTASRVA